MARAEDTLHEVTEVAVIEHPERGVLLLHSEERRWHLPTRRFARGSAGTTASGDGFGTRRA